MEIRDKKGQMLIEVWLTQAESLTINRRKLAESLLANREDKCKVIFFCRENQICLTAQGNCLFTMYKRKH